MNSCVRGSLAPRRPASPPRVLVADDDADERLLLSLALTRAGYNVTIAANGEDAWAKLQTEDFNLLCTDHNMPRLCGLDLVARLRAAGMMLPVIVNSGRIDLGKVSDYPQLGLAAVLQKTSEFTELLGAMRRILPLPHGLEDRAVRNVPWQRPGIFAHKRLTQRRCEA